jgi:hypothetical protein
LRQYAGGSAFIVTITFYQLEQLVPQSAIVLCVCLQVLVMPALALVVISFRALWGCFRRRNDEIGASNEVTRPEVQIWRDTFFAAMVLYPQVRRASTSPARLRQCPTLN